MLNIAVSEDVDNERKELVQKLQEILNLSNAVYKVYEFDSCEQMFEVNLNFDMYFLDIQMKKLSGIEAAKIIRNKKNTAVIIFITGLKDYVFDAFDVHAFHYILKPIDVEKLKKVVISALEQFEETDKFIIAKTISESNKIYLKDILYIESQLRKLKVHTSYGIIEYYYKLADIEKQLPQNMFFRCHKSYIVNLKYVRSYDNSSIKLKNSEIIYISKYRLSDFSKAFMYYLKDEE